VTLISLTLILKIIKQIQQKPQIVTQVKVDTLVVRDTITVVIHDTTVITKYKPVIEEGIATLDTTLGLRKDRISLVIHLHTEFNLKDSTFQNTILGFPSIQYPVDTVYVNKTITIEKTITKNNFWKYIEIGVVGTAAGFIIGAIVAQ
jgi:hypothetical protein